MIWPFEDICPLETGDTWCPSIKDMATGLFNGYAMFNPHMTLEVNWFGETTHTEATDVTWTKWKPDKPTSPHWYEQAHLERLIAAYISHDRDKGTDRSVRTFVSEFDGRSSTQKRKKVLEETGLSRANLSVLATDDGLKSNVIAKLLAAMKKHTKPVKPNRLGVIGKDHFAIRLKQLGGDPEQFEYEKIARIDDGLPFVLESTFS